MPPKAPKVEAPAAKAFALPDLPSSGLWAVDAEPTRGSVALEEFALYTPKGLFRNDYLAYCKILGIWPHPRLLPYEADIDLPSESKSAVQTPTWRRAGTGDGKAGEDDDHGGASESARQRYFDFSIVSEVAVRGARVGMWDLVALCAALRTAGHVDTLVFQNAGLSAPQVCEIARVVPFTSVRTLGVEFNPLDDPHIVTTALSGGANAATGPPAHLFAMAMEQHGDSHRSVATVGAGGRAKFVHVFAQVRWRGRRR